ncbi:hypothetical protein Bca101_068296 [Brassica carinata]
MPPPCEGYSQNISLQLVDEDVVKLDGDEGDNTNNNPKWDEHFLSLPLVLNDEAIRSIDGTYHFSLVLFMHVPASDERPWTPPHGGCICMRCSYCICVFGFFFLSF